MAEAYIYCADIYCESCGEAIRKRLTDEGMIVDTADEYSYDSDDFPKGPFPDGGGEADCPQHCGSGEACLEAITLTEGDGRKVGAFLENPLTSYGVKYVREELVDDPDGEVVNLWADFYGLRQNDEEA